MNRILIEHVPLAPKKVRAVFSRPLHSYFTPLRRLMANSNTNNLSDYLAEPNVDGNNTIDWYTEVIGTSEARPLDTLPPDEQRDLLLKVKDYHTAIKQLQNDYQQKYDDGNEEARKPATLFKEIASYPEEHHIYSVDGKPKIVFWSHEPEKIFDIEKRLKKLDRELGLEKSSTGEGDGPSPPILPHSKPKYLYRDIAHLFYGSYVHFVGAVSFFAITLASLLMAMTLMILTWTW